MAALIYFTRELPGLSEELSEQGFQVYEALAVSEVLYLCKQHPRLIVVIDNTVEPGAANEVARRHINHPAALPDHALEAHSNSERHSLGTDKPKGRSSAMNTLGRVLWDLSQTV